MKAEIVYRTDHFEAQAFYDSHGEREFISITHSGPMNEFVSLLYEEDGAHRFSKWLEKRVSEPITLDPEFSQFFAIAQSQEEAEKWMRKASAVLDKSIEQYSSLFML